MSDMYLELKSRIPVVAARTHLGTARIQEAQDATGLSNEAIARLIPVSEKTWRRWKEAGEIPTAALPAVAKALRLELVGAADDPIELGGGATEPSEEQLDQLRDEVRETRAAVESLTVLVQDVLRSLPQAQAASD